MRFMIGNVGLIARGGIPYYLWVGLLMVFIVLGLFSYYHDVTHGLVVSNLSNIVPWGFQIANYTFLVGVAAAAVVLVIPAYIYNWKPIREIAILGEMLAISAILMAHLFVITDIGRPDRAWHLFPFLGTLNFPLSMMGWNVVMLNLYLAVNIVIVFYMLYMGFMKKPLNWDFVTPILILSIPMAISIHTVTAFLYNGLAARPFFNAGILAPRFLASAFCSGPAFLLIIMQIVRRVTKLEIKDEALWKIAELMAYAMGFNLFLLGAEVFKEYYSGTQNMIFIQYLYEGIGDHKSLIIFSWFATIFNVTAFLLFLFPTTRKNLMTMNIGAVLIFMGIYMEKGICLIIPGLTPGPLGEIYEYVPSMGEYFLAWGIWALGLLVFTFLLKIAIPLVLTKEH